MNTRTAIGVIYVMGFLLAENVRADFGQPLLATRILGSTVEDVGGQKIGTVKDLALDLKNGRIVEVIVARGGFLGLDEKLAATLPQNFTMEASSPIVRFNLSAEMLNAAPPVRLSQWQEETTHAHLEQVYQYYGVRPYFLIEQHFPHATSPATTQALGDVLRATTVVGMETITRDGARIGRTENIIVDLPQGRVVEVVIHSGTFLGLPGELSAVPPQVLGFDDAHNTLTFDTTKDDLSGAPHFSSGEWPQLTRDQATEVYQAYHVVPYFLPGVGEAHAAGAYNYPPASDEEITAQIEKAIHGTKSLSADAWNVNITAVSGRVTLRGTVDSLAQKRELGEIAARFVPAANVDNRLEVKETADSAAN